MAHGFSRLIFHRGQELTKHIRFGLAAVVGLRKKGCWNKRSRIEPRTVRRPPDAALVSCMVRYMTCLGPTPREVLRRLYLDKQPKAVVSRELQISEDAIDSIVALAKMYFRWAKTQRRMVTWLEAVKRNAIMSFLACQDLTIDTGGGQKQSVNTGRERSHRAPSRDFNSRDLGSFVQGALTRIQHQYGAGALEMANEVPDDLNRLSTGSFSLDHAIGGGIPLGRVTEIFGPEGTGKTTIALNIIGEAQKQGGIGLLIDAEHSFSPSYASSLGIDLNKLLICRPNCAETALSVIQEVVASKIVSVAVIDSVAALVPKVERESTFHQPGPDDLARLLSGGLRKLVGPLKESGVALILVNQLRTKVGTLFGNPDTTPGGRAVRYYSSLRLEVRKVSAIKEKSRAVGTRIAVHVVKSKVSAPQSPIELEIRQGQGFCYEADLIDAGLTLGTIEKRGTTLKFSSTELPGDRSRAIGIIREDTLLRQALSEAVKQAWYRAAQPQSAVSCTH